MEKVGKGVLFLNTHTSELAVRHHQPGLVEFLSHFAKKKIKSAHILTLCPVITTCKVCIRGASMTAERIMYLICHIQCSLHGTAVINNSLKSYWAVVLRQHSPVCRASPFSLHTDERGAHWSAVKTSSRTRFEVVMNRVRSPWRVWPAHK